MMATATLARAVPSLRTAWTATALYLGIALVFTWPLALGLTRDVPWDMGDPVLNIWILGWSTDHLLRLLTGDLSAWSEFWNANIFHPEPLTLAYSEHFVAQAVQVLPVYAVTKNVILCYNLLFLSTFVLSGLGMFLFVRQLTGSLVGGFVAGLVFAFMPMRVPQFSHLQVMSSHWMPFVLLGIRRYFDTGRKRALAGAGSALVVQNLSCGYFLLYFAPFVGLYALYEILVRRRARDLGVWRDLTITAVLVIAVTGPFLLPYLQLRQLGFPPRPLSEVMAFSADVYSYLTAPAESWVWGQWLPVRLFPKPEGDLFTSCAALLMAACGFGASVQAAWRTSAASDVVGRTRSWAAWLLAVVAVVYGILALIVFLGFGFARLGPLPIRVTDLTRMAGIAALASALRLYLVPQDRRFVWTWLREWPAFCVLAAALALVLSLGPTAKAWGEPMWLEAPYRRLYDDVPGFDGLRVPARYGVVVMVFVAALAGEGARGLARWWPRHGAAMAVAGGLLVVVEALAAPIAINGANPQAAGAAHAGRLLRGADVPAVYRFVQTLPRDAVIAEFPFGRIEYEVRYMYYSTQHWRRLVNGYSGTFPPSYDERVSFLREPDRDPDRSWASLIASGATHAIVHAELFDTPAQAESVEQWFTAHGARVVADLPGGRVLALAR